MDLATFVTVVGVNNNVFVIMPIVVKRTKHSRWRANHVHERHREQRRCARSRCKVHRVEVGQRGKYLVDLAAVHGKVSGDLVEWVSIRDGGGSLKVAQERHIRQYGGDLVS